MEITFLPDEKGRIPELRTLKLEDKAEERLVDNIIQLCQERGLDGIDASRPDLIIIGFLNALAREKLPTYGASISFEGKVGDKPLRVTIQGDGNITEDMVTLFKP